MVAAGGLFVLGPPVLNWFFVQVGLQSAPPTRPPSLPQTAQPIAVYGNASSEVTEWKWVVCEEREAPRYACRVYGVQDRLEIVGDYWAYAGRYGLRGHKRRGRLPNPGETLQYSTLVGCQTCESSDPETTIHLASPLGGRLIPRGVLLFPARGTKVTVLGEDGDLGDETAMSPEERATVAR